MPILRNEYNSKAMGGTELLIKELEERVDRNLLSQVTIIPGRMRGMPDDKTPKIFWVHDTYNDPEMAFLANGGWKVFQRLVFVSFWQMNSFIQAFDIPHSMCVVLKNAVPEANKKRKFKPLLAEEPIKIIYHTTPHRGLNILQPVFQELQRHHNITLDVFSSFAIYGWENIDLEFADLYEALKNTPNVTYHGSKPYEVVRNALSESHIFAYPSIWAETSCRCLMESMIEGTLPVHSSLAALPETASNMTTMYSYHEDVQEHAQLFLNTLEVSILQIRERPTEFSKFSKVNSEISTIWYGWEDRTKHWNDFLKSELKL